MDVSYPARLDTSVSKPPNRGQLFSGRVEESSTPEYWTERYQLPWASAADDFGHGVRRMERKWALKRRNIQANPSTVCFNLVIDVDHPDALYRAFNSDLPLPSWVAQSDSGRAHVGYMLAYPVLLQHQLRKPERLLAQVERGLIRELDGDPAYNGLLTKNPLHPDWETVWGNSQLHTLRDMAKQLQLDLSEPLQRPKKRLEEYGYLGRNCQLFDATREWAYSAIRRYWEDSLEDWTNAVHDHISLLNQQLATPLTEPEIKATAKSIAGWTWAQFTPEDFQRWSAAGRAKSLQVRQEKASDKAAEIQALKDAGLTNKQVAEKLSVTVDSVKGILKRARKKQETQNTTQEPR